MTWGTAPHVMFVTYKMQPQQPIQNEIVTVVKTCSSCGVPLRNDTYGGRCEDCFADNAGNLPHSKRVAQADPLPPDPPKRKRTKRSLDDYDD